MAKKKGRFPTLAILLVVGVFVFGFGLVQIELPDLLPFSITDQANISCDGVNCEWQLLGRSFASPNPKTNTHYWFLKTL